MKKYYKNFILCRETDYHCLICEEILKEQADVERHIRWMNHRRQLKDATNLPRFGDECVVKLGKIYYCEVCNIVMPTTIATFLHIADPKHVPIKQTTEEDDPQTPEDQCILCEMDLDYIGVGGHMTTLSHIDSDMSFCFTCKQSLETVFFEDHWTIQEKEHLDNKDINSNNTDIETSEMASKLQEFQLENIDINFEKSRATCKKCNFAPAFTAKAITEHIKMHKKAENDSPGFQPQQQSEEDSDEEFWYELTYGSNLPEPESQEDQEDLNYMGNIDHGQLRAELAWFGKPNFIKLVQTDSKAKPKGYCSLCNTYISAHINNFKQHVEGAKHLDHIELQKTQNGTNTQHKKEYRTRPLKMYVKRLSLVHLMDDFWINERLCVDKYSFCLICPTQNNGESDSMKCLVCDDVFPSDKDLEHCKSTEHKDKMFATNLLFGKTLEREFIRELRPNVFHCGFCNEVTQSWVAMKRHLKTLRHLECKDQQKMVADLAENDDRGSVGDIISEKDSMWSDLYEEDTDEFFQEMTTSKDIFFYEYINMLY